MEKRNEKKYDVSFKRLVWGVHVCVYTYMHVCCREVWCRKESMMLTLSLLDKYDCCSPDSSLCPQKL